MVSAPADRPDAGKRLGRLSGWLLAVPAAPCGHAPWLDDAPPPAAARRAL